MNSYRKTSVLTFAASLALALCVPATAQQTGAADTLFSAGRNFARRRPGAFPRRRKQLRRKLVRN